MADRRVFRVLPSKADGDWLVSGPSGTEERFATQEEAQTAARHHAQEFEPSQVVVHDRRGRIRAEWTYGEDPRDVPG